MNNLFDSRLLQMYRLTVKLIVLDYVGNAGHRQKVTRESGVSPGVDVVRFLIRLQREHTHPHARTHTQTLDTHTLPADVWRMLFFLRGMRWAVGGGGGS